MKPDFIKVRCDDWAGLSDRAAIVLGLMRWYAHNEAALCWASLRTLAAARGKSTRWVRMGQQELLKAGRIVEDEPRRGRGKTFRIVTSPVTEDRDLPGHNCDPTVTSPVTKDCDPTGHNNVTSPVTETEQRIDKNKQTGSGTPSGHSEEAIRAEMKSIFDGQAEAAMAVAAAEGFSDRPEALMGALISLRKAMAKQPIKKPVAYLRGILKRAEAPTAGKTHRAPTWATLRARYGPQVKQGARVNVSGKDGVLASVLREGGETMFVVSLDDKTGAVKALVNNVTFLETEESAL